MANKFKNGYNTTISKAKHFFDNFFKVIKRPDMVLLPGNLAFFFVLAIVPAIGLISYGASMLNLNTHILFQFVEENFSTDIANLILGVSYGGMPTFKFIITILIGFYIASNGADCMITTSNAIYGFENKSWYRRRIKACLMTFMIVLLFIFLLIVPVFGDGIVALITVLDLPTQIINNVTLIYNVMQGPITWVIIFLIIKFLYSVAPNKDDKYRVTNYGAVFTTVMWIIITSIYSYYATNFASYTVLYGNLANVVVLMIWFFCLSFVFTIGIALNYKEDQFKLEKTGTIKKIKKEKI